jgi:ectoine hydroxylase-related dioxygenase (phytanoyl-CoA dioxygenase family)
LTFSTIRLEGADADREICDKLHDDLRQNGFAALDEITDADDVASIRTTMLRVLGEQQKSGAHLRDLGDDSTVKGEGKIIELTSPSLLAPELLQSRFFRRALRITRQFLGSAAARLSFDHCVIKPPFNETATAWHQDSAYARRITLSSRRLHWWLPLQTATKANGCMEFIAGSHRQRMQPHHPRAAGAHALEAELPPHAEAIVCPLLVGGATVHVPKTLHYTSPNATADTRLAWAVQIGIKGWIPAIVW